MRNPFKPTAGARPPVLVGRENTLDSFKESLADGPGAPGLLTIFTGARGVGKTVMLSEAERAAEAEGWVVISDTATTGLLDRLTRALERHLDELGDGPPVSKITAVTVAGVGLTRQPPAARPRTFRDLATELCQVTHRNETGVVISIDEIHAINRADMTALAADIQHLIREDLPISLITAGIPAAVDDLLGEAVSTFLRRAERVTLADVPLDTVAAALSETFEATAITLTLDQVSRAATATGGYPFLIQLVGYQVWRLAQDGMLTEHAFAAGVDAARVRLGATVLEAALNDLSDVDRTYLLKMAEDDGPSSTRTIADRLNRDPRFASVYRGRLIAAGVIAQTSIGYVDFAVPGLREYLREHAASIHGIRR